MPSSLLFWDVDTTIRFHGPGGQTLCARRRNNLEPPVPHRLRGPVRHSNRRLDRRPPRDRSRIQAISTPLPRRYVCTEKGRGYAPIEKQTVDVFTDLNTDSLLKLLGGREIILYAVVTEICVDRTARGLILRDHRVHLVKDAVRHLDSHRAQATVHYVQQHGGRLLTTSEVLSGVLESAA